MRVAGLWKEYKLGRRARHSDTLYELIGALLRRPFRRRVTRSINLPEKFWALRDVSFEVTPGEVLGIIGRNGAGKSTLLKILARITEPTAGRVEIVGRVASLLEVGTGFHPELTGRENIRLNGAILGMSRREIADKFDEIVAFAEVEGFLDTPVKRYSSGMYVRLAFAVAAHVEPDLLIVDEVLAVGDAQFQKKCLEKIGQVGGEGRTVLFVSHNMTAVQSLCSRAIWLDHGSVVADSAPRDVVSAYLNQDATLQQSREWTTPEEAPGNELVRIRACSVRPEGGAPGERIDRESAIELSFEYWNLAEGARLHLSLQFVDERGYIVFNTVPLREVNWQGKQLPRGLFRSICTVPAHLLNYGIYRVGIYVVRDQVNVIYGDENALIFTVHEVPEPGLAWHGTWTGAVRPLLPWTTDYLGPVHNFDESPEAESRTGSGRGAADYTIARS